MTKESKNGTISGKRTVSFQCIDAIEPSLFIEKEGLRFYEKAAKNVFDPREKDMFTRLAEEVKRGYQDVANQSSVFITCYFRCLRENVDAPRLICQ